MYVCMCIYIYIYIYINACIEHKLHTCIHTCTIHTYIRTDIHTYVHANINKRMHTDISTYIYIYTHIYIYVYIDPFEQSCMIAQHVCTACASPSENARQVRAARAPRAFPRRCTSQRSTSATYQRLVWLVHSLCMSLSILIDSCPHARLLQS